MPGGLPDLRGITLRNLAELARMQGDLVRATALYEEGFAAAPSAERQYAQAARLCAAAMAMRELAQTPLPPSEQEAFEQTIATARTALGEPIFREEWSIGEKFTNNQSIDYALSDACS